jgi:hypothetical protein
MYIFFKYVSMTKMLIKLHITTLKCVHTYVAPVCEASMTINVRTEKIKMACFFVNEFCE